MIQCMESRVAWVGLATLPVWRCQQKRVGLKISMDQWQTQTTFLDERLDQRAEMRVGDRRSSGVKIPYLTLVRYRGAQMGMERSRDQKEGRTNRAMFRLVRIPLRPPAGSSEVPLTRSIFDMMLIHGISRLTIADMAERTPLHIRKC